MNGVENLKDIFTIIPVIIKPFSSNVNKISINNCTLGITFRLYCEKILKMQWELLKNI